ncbi:MAG: holo-[acyl-carrier-protein] synthase [Gemmatimonadales bacterium]|nr:Holo-[acyl-carrier-protein] synthase [bacterium HR33]GIW51910.1 MAG: holo-[acyl-carrier-protein] synthase [Gemmatimonadales bacterium]
MDSASAGPLTPLGVGIDLVDIARVQRMLERGGEKLLRRLLTEGERRYCLSRGEPARHVAARVAAKEAAFKALFPSENGGYIGWQEFEVLRSPEGRPALLFKGRAQERARRMGVSRALISLSHSHTHAVAVVILL